MFPLAEQPLPIILPEGCVDSFAAEQLSFYLAIITGNRFPVVADAEQPAISLCIDAIAKVCRSTLQSATGPHSVQNSVYKDENVSLSRRINGNRGLETAPTDDAATFAITSIDALTMEATAAARGCRSPLPTREGGRGVGSRASFRICISPDGITLSGEDRLSLLHAVYYFLEKHCGCRWLSEWDGGEIVPRDTELAVPYTDETVSPVFTNRAFTNYPRIDRDTVTMLDWMAKNRFNRFMVFANVPDAFDDYRRVLRDEAILRGMKMEMGHHSFKYWLPPTEFHAARPEFFALVNGERVTDGQLCASNPAVAEIIAERIAAFFAENPEFDRVGLWPNDCYGWCECEACRALEPQSPSAFLADQPRRTDTYIRFVNRVADLLRPAHPDKRLSALAYVNYVEPPTLDIPDNVDVCFAPFTRCFKHPFAGYPDCTRSNALYAEFFDGWRARVSGELHLFEYTMLIDMCSLPFPLADMYPDNWAWLAAHGCDGYVMEFKPEEWGAYGLNAHLLGQYAWQPGLDIAGFVREHGDLLYGPAAAEMSAFLEAFMRDFVRPGPCVYHYDLTYARRATEDLLRPALERLGRARALAAKGEKRHWQAVEKARIGVELLLRVGEWQRALRDAHDAPEDTNKRRVLEGDVRRIAADLLAFVGRHAKSGAIDADRLRTIITA
jgi:hypothetical protein